MFVGTLRLDLRIPGCHSLKEKRHVLQSLVEGMRRKFNASVAEVGHQDTWQRADIGVAVVSSDKTLVRQMLDRVEEYVESEPGVTVVGSEIEVL